MGFVGELAKEIASQYREDLQRGKEMGPLADLVDAVLCFEIAARWFKVLALGCMMIFNICALF